MHLVNRRAARKPLHKKKKSTTTSPVDIEHHSQGPVLEYPWVTYDHLVQLIRSDFSQPSSDHEDASEPSDDEDFEEEQSKKRNITKKELKKELEKKRQQRQRKAWRQKKRKTRCGFLWIFCDDVRACCMRNFTVMMFSFIVLFIAIMFYMKFGQETFNIKDSFEAIDYYKILNISKSATTREIRRAYRLAAIKWHPDRNRGCGKKCEDKMAELSEAYIILTNPETRAFHDRFGVKPPDYMVELAKAKHGGRGSRKD